MGHGGGCDGTLLGIPGKELEGMLMVESKGDVHGDIVDDADDNVEYVECISFSGGSACKRGRNLMKCI